jgi:cell division protein FtsB
MRQRTVYEFDNRDSAQMYEYMEARIEALKRRIEQLEAENETLRSRDSGLARSKSYAA